MRIYLLVIFCLLFSLEANAQRIEIKKLENQSPKNFPVHVSDKLLEAEMGNIRNNPEHYQPLPFAEKRAADNVGDERDFYVINMTDDVIKSKKFRLMKKGNVSQIWFEIAEIDNGHLNAAVADSMFKYLESQSTQYSFNPEMGIVELINAYMGDPPDVDGDGLVDFLITDVQDGWDPDDGGGYTAGFFYSYDQRTDAQATQSNKRDVLYIDSYPGIYNDGDINATKPLSVLAHEYQHLVHFNYNGRLGINEITFVNEAQSNFSSLLSGYFPHSSYSRYLSSTNVPLFRWSDGSDLLADYGRSASFSSYLWDQLGFEHSGFLTQEPLSGLSGIRSAMTKAGSEYSFEELFVNWGIANLLNDQELTNKTEYGYNHELLQDQKVPIDFLKPNLSNQTTNVQPGGIYYFGFQQVSDFKVTVSHGGGGQGQAHFIASTGETIEVFELNAGEEFITPDELHYEHAYLMLTYTDPDAGNPLVFTTNLTGTQSYELSNLSTFGGTLNNSPGYFTIDGNDILGFSNRFQISKDANLFAAELYIPNDEKAGDTDLKIAVYNDNSGKPGTETDSDTVSFSTLSFGWNTFNLDHLNIELQKDQAFHIVYEILSPTLNAVLPVLVDNGTGTQGVTNIFTKERTFSTFDLTIGDEYGLWNRIVLAEEVIVSNEPIAETPQNFELQQNYPNPFNPSTVISYHLSMGSDVKLEVFDLAGRKVATLVNEKLSAGNHEVIFNAQNLASGMYFYSIKAGDFTETRKMILMK